MAVLLAWNPAHTAGAVKNHPNRDAGSENYLVIVASALLIIALALAVLAAIVGLPTQWLPKRGVATAAAVIIECLPAGRRAYCLWFHDRFLSNLDNLFLTLLRFIVAIVSLCALFYSTLNFFRHFRLLAQIQSLEPFFFHVQRLRVQNHFLDRPANDLHRIDPAGGTGCKSIVTLAAKEAQSEKPRTGCQR